VQLVACGDLCCCLSLQRLSVLAIEVPGMPRDHFCSHLSQRYLLQPSPLTHLVLRCGIDAIEILLADPRCNIDKRDLLPALPHVTAWARRDQRHGTAFTGLATASRWDTDSAATVAVARSIYGHLPPGPNPAVAGPQGCPQRRPSRSRN
jgi:hypothetical protein